MDYNTILNVYFSENLLSLMRGALLMLYIVMCVDLYSKRENNPILSSLFWLVAAMAVLLTISSCFMFESLKNSEYFRTLKVLINVCFVPLAGGYLLKILIPGKIRPRTEMLISTPTVSCFVLYAIIENKILVPISLWYTTVLLVAMIIFIVYLSFRYDRYLKNNFSNIDNMSVQWVRVFVYLCAIWYLIWRFMINLDGYLPEALYYLFLVFIWSYIYKYSEKHIMTSSTWELFESAPPIGITPEAESAAKEKLIAALEQYMKNEEHWLNSNLTLKDMAADLGTNRTYLSDYFNSTLDTTFYDYLNNFRIKYACEILLADPKMPITQILEKSGFKSRSTFSRVFEKHTGYSPRNYRNKRLDA
jgi:AraC-type DNA-binding domain-containing proteins